MAELLAGMLTALELAAAYLQANMLRFVVLVDTAFLLPPLGRSLLSRATALSALMSSAVELGSANAETLRMRDVALVTSRPSLRPSAPA